MGGRCRGQDITLTTPDDDAYGMRMAKVSASIPDEVVAAAKAAGLNISGLATSALRAELDRRDKVAQLDAWLAAMEVEFGPIPPHELEGASAWAERFDDDP